MADGLVMDGKRKAMTFGEGDETVHAKRVARSPCDATVKLGSGDMFLEAIAKVQHAIEEAVEAGKVRFGAPSGVRTFIDDTSTQEELIALDAKYYAGMHMGLNLAVVDATKRLKDSGADLNALGDKINSKVNSSPIYRLPTEIIYSVFAHLDTDGLFACRDTCHYWRSLLESAFARESIWKEAAITIRGDIADVDAQRVRLSLWKDMDNLTSLAITLIESQSRRRQDTRVYILTDVRPDRSKVFMKFPTECLHTLKIGGDLYGHEEKLWDYILQCKTLKVLHWMAREVSACGVNLDDYRYLRDKTLGLEEFHFGSTLGHSIDIRFVRTLSQVKRLNLEGGLGMMQILAFLDAAQDYLEEVSISNVYFSGGRMFGSWPEEPMTNFVMATIQRLSFDGSVIGCPYDTKPIDSILLDSCRNNIRSLHIKLEGATTKGGLDQELFDMPQLEVLHLNYRHWFNKVVRCYQECSTAAFWETVKSNDDAKIQGILPILKKLRIIHDPMLDQGLFLQYMSARERLHHQALESVEIWLANHCSEDTSRLDAKRLTNPGFSFVRFDEWATSDIREWALETDKEQGFR